MNDVENLYNSIKECKTQAEKELPPGETCLVVERLLELSRDLDKTILEFSGADGDEDV